MLGYGGPIIQPDDSWIRINNGETSTTSRAVTLHLFCRWAGQMRIADGTDPSSATWEDYARTKSWTLPTGDGSKTVSVEFRAYENDDSAIATDTITLDENGVPSTLKELMMADMTQVALNEDEAAEELTLYDPVNDTTTICLGILNRGREDRDNAAPRGRKLTRGAQLTLSYADCPEPNVDMYVVDSSGIRWNIISVISNDHIAGVDIDVASQKIEEAYGEGFRRK